MRRPASTSQSEDYVKRSSVNGVLCIAPLPLLRHQVVQGNCLAADTYAPTSAVDVAVVAASPDGSRIAAACDNRTVGSWQHWRVEVVKRSRYA